MAVWECCDNGEFGNSPASLPGNRCRNKGWSKRADKKAQGTFHCSSVGHSHPSSAALGSHYLKDVFVTLGIYDKEPVSAGYLEILRVQMPRPELVLHTPCTANRENHLGLLPCCNSSHVSEDF